MAYQAVNSGNYNHCIVFRASSNCCFFDVRTREREEIRDMQEIKRQDMITQARCLWCDGGDEEYIRGICELVAYCFPVMDEDADVTAEKIREEIEA